MRIKKLLKLPKWLLVVVMLGGGFTYWQEVQQREYHAYAGLPIAQDWKDWQRWHHVLRNPGFMVGYSDIRMNPLWVTYRLEAKEAGGSGARPSGFDEDWRSIMRVKHGDYTGSGYDRGHLAPNYAIAKVHGREAQLKTFLMTNISPQTPNLNRRVWQRMEQSAMDHFAVLKKEVWVITGPIFDDNIQRIPGKFIEIPDAFYKIFIAPPSHNRPLEVLAFVVPQDVKGYEPLAQFVTTVREVETATGLNFLHRLPQVIQDQIETTKTPNAWQLEKVSTTKGRF
ncbi:MAG TPA: DNA/RNA non-specific endonuclease [Marinospirillum sp.]|uniref:DNA/RNA non-specific endonuclease n=1 Tax=Marinospirillum sp. TaxID=2183934 RepID=UPI002B48F391|nr:DNA/RNA non-specific endonuclease [Marinospirillum sp.]HKM16079.1 DNA/RNA non-specific endonuclease [Marinospirillum sp.]